MRYPEDEHLKSRNFLYQDNLMTKTKRFSIDPPTQKATPAFCSTLGRASAVFEAVNECVEGTLRSMWRGHAYVT